MEGAGDPHEELSDLSRLRLVPPKATTTGLEDGDASPPESRRHNMPRPLLLLQKAKEKVFPPLVLCALNEHYHPPHIGKIAT
jgi:hypothetical protein